MRYRQDVDGLRAVAVLSVIAFHYFPPVLRGGFIGVDLFFVISGYLISGIIFREIESREFSILVFYRRRIIRIFPALGSVLAASLVLGWITLFPDEFKSLGRNTLASTAFFENIYLWMQAGYFDSDSVRKPLLHIWSLGVEEQFYILYPAMLIVAHRLRMLNTNFLAACCIISFIGSVVVTRYWPSAAFYLPLSRYWELSVGGLLAWRERGAGSEDMPPARDLSGPPALLAGAGALAIAAGFLLINANTPFPGTAAILPVAGAALVIGAGPLGGINRWVLSNPVAVFVGKISYPLYLWHWPLLSFLYVVNIEKPEPPIRLVLLVLAFVLATATWWWVEAPIRKQHNNGRTALLLLALLAAFGATGWAIGWQSGVPAREVNRINAGETVTASGIDNPPLPVQDCAVPSDVARQFRNCIQERETRTRFVLLGDSKADALYRGLMTSSRPGARWLYLGGADATTFGAPEPLISDNPAWSRVQSQSRAAIDYVVESPDIHLVLYAAAVRNIYRLDDSGGAGRLFQSYDHRFLRRLNGNALAAQARVAMLEAIGRLVRAGKTVAILVDNPPLPSLRSCNGRLTASDTLNALLGLRKDSADPDCFYAKAQFREDAKVYLDLLASVQSTYGERVMILDFTDVYCQARNGTACGTSVAGNALYGYTDHISNFTAALIGQSINERLHALGSP